MALVTEHNKAMNTLHENRTRDALFNRFKKLSRIVFKLIGIMETAPKFSGDNSQEKYDELCKKTFIERFPEDSGFLDTVWNCQSFLRDKPKWRSWQKKEIEDEEQRKAEKKRPVRNKKVKQLEKDRQLVEATVGTECICGARQKG